MVKINKKMLTAFVVGAMFSGYTLGSNRLIVQPRSLFAPAHLGEVELSFNKDHFSVNRNGQNHKVNSYDVDPSLRNLKVAGLKAFLKQGGRLSLAKVGEEDYAVRMAGNLKGGGPLAATQAYWATKVGLYAALGVAVGGTVVATGGAVAGAASAVAGGTATASTLATGLGAGLGGTALTGVATGSAASGLAVGATTAVTTVVAGAEAGVAAGTIATGVTAVAEVAAAGTAGSTAVGIAASTAAAIETASCAAFMAALTCPLTPW